MAQMNFNANEHEVITFEPLPEGEYVAAISASEMKTTKAGNGEYLELDIVILNDEFKNRKIKDRIHRSNPSEMAVKIGNSTLSSICVALDIVILKDSVELHNKPIIIKVGQTKEDSQGKIYNEINSYSKYEAAKEATQVTTSTTHESLTSENSINTNINAKPDW